MKKIIFISLTFLIVFTAVSFSFIVGGSNLSLSIYPGFDAYLPYNPDKRDIERYIAECEEYIENANNDIYRIQYAKEEAIQKVNDAIYRYNRGY